jgi:hypothetical protein
VIDNFNGFVRYEEPFTHWINTTLLAPGLLRALNAEWPYQGDERWHHEVKGWSKKSAMMFPRELPPTAQSLARELYAPRNVAHLSALTGIELLPDPWFESGPLMPRVGGGLHEIHPGGMLNMHVDFSAHPAGLTRALNFLIYLNEEWRDEWNGALELGDDVKIYPRGGTAVIFETTDTSWHGHPVPLACPEGKSRRSLALYYYRQSTEPPERITTLYRAN